MKHLLVTNDFPPKIGGIQSLLWEWWRRLPSESFAVLTSPYAGSDAFDASQPFRIERTREPVLLPHPLMVHRINSLAREIGADFVVVDPAVPLGLLGPSLELPYMVVVHGAEVTVPGRLPVSSAALARVLKRSTHVIAAGGYPAAEARRLAGSVPITVILPGVDVQRFSPLDEDERARARDSFGVDRDAQLVVGLSRLVPRKGFDVLIEASARLRDEFPRLVVLIGGGGRDESRLNGLIERHRAPARLIGRVSNESLPAFYGCADVSAMVCRSRWGGLEQEGFGIVFAEAAACGVAQLAGRSGGAAEAVVDGETGLVVDDPTNVALVADALRSLLSDDVRRAAMARASRVRAVAEFDYAVLSARLGAVLGVSS